MTDSRLPPTKGWTPERQIRFLDALAATRSVTKAAAAAGMSRESAHRLRNRSEGALFAALWDLAVAGPVMGMSEGHSDSLRDGSLLRLLTTHFRRKSGDFAFVGQPSSDATKD